ncbi:hypothetical protein BOX15_Mlig034182g2 [Macrostomum lignano]|uniref:Uncharacterized protein n=3 Tax=Macrostomum lignano TaxID=282301 RepID=A0A267G0Q7_9PLAT|nr:hypothetical protein BOX15_Mlig034182g1 [Macrostomum lignano]PAA79685.1 hypothetical protein BOX15_Mlig034182g3 [Macrostomum lignano]PAA81025.1 hypothetical protein BOX15_Mlig034182g2 [Macrostomum lignano]
MAESQPVSESFQKFYEEVKQIEHRDAVLTPKQQIDRLNRPGSSYFNLNPFDVLQVDPETPLTEIKKKYRQMSLLVHPDKNPGTDRDRAQRAFEACNRAFKTLDTDEGYKRCLEIVEEAKRKVAESMDEKRKRRRKEGLSSEIEEDDPAGHRKAVYVQTCRLFADLEKLRQNEETRAANERKRKAVEEEAAKEAKEHQREWQKNFEESRHERTQSWRSFNAAGPAAASSAPAAVPSSGESLPKKKKKAKKGKGNQLGFGFRPPKHKAEERPQNQS